MRMVPLRAAEPSLPEQMRAEHLGCPVVEVGCSVPDVGVHRTASEDVLLSSPASQKLCRWEGHLFPHVCYSRGFAAAVQTKLDGQLYWVDPT